MAVFGKMEKFFTKPALLSVYLILSIAVEATIKVAIHAAQKLIHPPIPPTRIRQMTANASRLSIVMVSAMRRNAF